ncbi:hypothetical protein Tco_1504957 [Tanacetum coccineum]
MMSRQTRRTLVVAGDGEGFGGAVTALKEMMGYGRLWRFKCVGDVGGGVVMILLVDRRWVDGGDNDGVLVVEDHNNSTISFNNTITNSDGLPRKEEDISKTSILKIKVRNVRSAWEELCD